MTTLDCHKNKTMRSFPTDILQSNNSTLIYSLDDKWCWVFANNKDIDNELLLLLLSLFVGPRNSLPLIYFYSVSLVSITMNPNVSKRICRGTMSFYWPLLENRLNQSWWPGGHPSHSMTSLLCSPTSANHKDLFNKLDLDPWFCRRSPF